MPPSYNEVTSWKPEVMAQIAFGVVRLQAHLEVEAPKAGNPVLNLAAAQWHGEARGAADTRAEGVTRWIRNTADEFGDLAEVLQTGATNIRNAIAALESRTTLADSRGYILDRGSRGYAINFDPARAPEGAEFDAGEAFEHQSALSGLATAADDTVTATRDGINGALGEIGGITPATIAANRGTADPTLAESDAKAVRDGTATPEQRGRYLRAMGFTPAQLEQLANGELCTIESSRLEYALAAVGLKGIDPKSAAATAAFAALQRRAQDIAHDFNPDRRSHAANRSGVTPERSARISSTATTLGKRINGIGIAVTLVDEFGAVARGEQGVVDAAAASAGSIAGGAIGGWAVGAAVGSFAGPVGTLVGAGIGAAIGSKWGSDLAKSITGG
ncbi:hypothetical protein GONAM_56_00770 [Gordonia namibiensis NBRC 108229]|uniref:Uncharacterized protein n=1 Tax=Gordonia namibiensis NBRC 108229 TaxID=1208314 RepID=K6XUR0_9ACTN|nr:hypothetical protein [Gordonia namibiensis]GAC02605.1 hypothetical protein GONAM_56_00770 [Gordonia namibiensis NBRC 108229]